MLSSQESCWQTNMNAGKEAPRISPISMPFDDANLEDQAFEQDMEHSGTGRGEVKKCKRSCTPESNYRQYIPYGPYDEEYHKYKGTPENWYGEVGEGKGRFIADELVMFRLSIDEIQDRLKVEALQKAQTRSTKNEYIGVPMIFNSTANANLPVQTHDPYYESKDIPRGQHKDNNRRGYVPAKLKVVVPGNSTPAAVAPPHVNNHGTLDSAQYLEEKTFSTMNDSIYTEHVPSQGNGVVLNTPRWASSKNTGSGSHLETSSPIFGHPAMVERPAPQFSLELANRVRAGHEILSSSPFVLRHPRITSPDRTVSNRKRKVKTYSVNDPNKKRAYKWKDGKAPMRRLGHVKYPEGHEFHNMPKRGAYVVEKQGEDNGEEEDDEDDNIDDNMEDHEYGG